MTKLERLNAANELLRQISACGRKFFYSSKHERLAEFVIADNGRLYYIDDHNGHELPLSHVHSRKWRRYFSHGGTLKSLIESLADYIREGILVERGHFFAPSWVCNGDPWGYGNDMMLVRNAAISLGVTATTH